MEDSTALTIIERDFLHVVERELSEVDLPILRITEFDAVIENTEMVGSHTADINGLDTSHSAIVFQLQAREIAQGICYRQGIQLLEFLACQRL